MNPDHATESLPHFRRRASDPVLPAGAIGLLVHTDGIDGASEAPRWPLRGSFRVPRSDGGGEPQSVLQRIVISLTDLSTHEVQARHAFRDELLFPEDVREEGSLISGDFHVDLLRLFEFRLGVTDETYFVAASIGEDVAPIVRCTCHMPWLAAPPDEFVEGDPGVGDDDDPAEGDEDEDEEDDDDTSWMVNEPL
jgi:hypothetical protein